MTLAIPISQEGGEGSILLEDGSYLLLEGVLPPDTYIPVEGVRTLNEVRGPDRAGISLIGSGVTSIELRE